MLRAPQTSPTAMPSAERQIEVETARAHRAEAPRKNGDAAKHSAGTATIIDAQRKKLVSRGTHAAEQPGVERDRQQHDVAGGRAGDADLDQQARGPRARRRASRSAPR